MLAEGVPFISKPFTSEALAEKVREALDDRCEMPEPHAPEA
jgi:FixJ family two-component response regulator